MTPPRRRVTDRPATQPFAFTKTERHILRELYNEDVSPYRASTSPKLTRKVPTAEVVALYAGWRHGD